MGDGFGGRISSTVWKSRLVASHKDYASILPRASGVINQSVKKGIGEVGQVPISMWVGENTTLSLFTRAATKGRLGLAILFALMKGMFNAIRKANGALFRAS